MTEITLPREYLIELRRSLLMQIDAIEILLGLSPLTKELRKEAREEKKKEHEQIPKENVV